jgi:thioesterase domain-containing protein/acyl carrier protein
MSMPMPEISIAPSTRSSTEIRAWIVAEVAKTLDVDPATVDTGAALYSLGIDSLAAIQMTGKLSEWLNRNLPASLVWDFASIDAMAEGLANGESSAPGPAVPGIVVLQPHGNNSPVFFFPGLGGHPVTFAALATHLGPTQPCYGLIVPGFDGEKKPLTHVEEIAAVMLQSIRQVQPKGPYQLAGYSFGGFLAYEAAQQLIAAGETVSMLAIYDTFAPGGRVPRPLWQRLALQFYLILKEPGRAAHLFQRIRRLRAVRRAEMGTARSDSENLIERRAFHSKNIKRVNSRAIARYRPQPYPGSILLFRASHRASYNILYNLDATNGWSALTGPNRVRVIDIPGSHYTLLDGINAPVAAQRLRPFLSDNGQLSV